MKTILFLASGNGGNLKFFYLAQKQNLISEVTLIVIADRECGSIDFARKNNIENYIISYKRSNPIALTDILLKVNPDIIITNWHKIIDEDTVAKYSGKLINLHYSLLPAFDGLIGIEPIKQAYEKNCQYIGTTCHYVDEGVDSGKIIAQALLKTNIPIDKAIQQIFRKGCLILLNSIIQLSDREIIQKSCNEKFDFSPNLSFNDAVFNEVFWGRISEL